MSFVSRPMPATRPSNGYRRGSGRPRIRSATYENATQTGTSSIVGWNSTPSPSPYGVSAKATAARSWLRKPPPSSRAQSATSTIDDHSREHAGQAQGDERRAGDADHEPADERRRRGEVDVPERQVSGSPAGSTARRDPSRSGRGTAARGRVSAGRRSRLRATPGAGVRRAHAQRTRREETRSSAVRAWSSAWQRG